MDEMMISPEGKLELSHLQSADEDDIVSIAGCTSTVILVTKTEIYCANAGDSRTVMSKRGTARDLSKDHKPDDPLELRRIERSGNFVDNGRVNG